MKKYIFSLFALLVLGTGLVYAQGDEGTTGANTKREISGALGYVPYKELQLVRYAETQNLGSLALSAGDVVVWNTISDDGVTIGLVGTTGSVDSVAGVVVSTIINTADSTGTTPGVDYGRRNWGFIQVRGLCPVVNVTSGGPAGSSLIASSVSRYATGTPGELTTAGTTPRVYRFMGFAYDASSQGQSEALLDL